jgi:serine protease Do
MGLEGGDRIVSIGGKQVALGGDIILSVEDIPVVSEDNIENIRNLLAGMPPGAPFKMSVLRAGNVFELTGTSQ